MEMLDTYTTKDLAEASALIVSGQALIQINRSNGVCWFEFRGKSQCEELSRQFFFGELLVNAREFHEATNRLKNRIFSSP